jgi:hypothetical protein
MQKDLKKTTMDTGLRFAEELVAKRYVKARSMLTTEMQRSWSAEKLSSQFEQMISYGSGPVKVDGHTEFMKDWPDRKPGDYGWLYVSISGTDFGEAITVIVADEGGQPKIRGLEWGRP